MASKYKYKNVFEKQVILFLGSTSKVKRICKLISAEKAAFQREKRLCYKSNAQCLPSVHAIRDARG